MADTFKAILRGNQLEWATENPMPPQTACLVQVTVLAPVEMQGPAKPPAADETERGLRMASLLEQLASLPAVSVADAARWEREIRQDRALPARDSHAD